MRKEYEARTSYYIGGQDAEWAAKKLARKVADPDHKMKDEDIFFVVGSCGGIMRGYQGQPVVLWPKKVGESMTALTKHENNFSDLFNPFVVQQDWREPGAEGVLNYRYNIAYGSEMSDDVIKELVKEGMVEEYALTRLPIRIDIKEDGGHLQIAPNWITSNGVFLGEFVPLMNKDLAERRKNKKLKGKKKKK